MSTRVTERTASTAHCAARVGIATLRFELFVADNHAVSVCASALPKVVWVRIRNASE